MPLDERNHAEQHFNSELFKFSILLNHLLVDLVVSLDVLSQTAGQNGWIDSNFINPERNHG